MDFVGEAGLVASRLSLCVIVRNGREDLERCINSARPYVDEIVVVDTGSTDGTLELLPKLAHRFRSTRWQDDFSAARNEALELATGEWVLVLDADESLDGQHALLLREALANPRMLAYQLLIVHHLGQGVLSKGVYTFRLFRRRPQIRYRYRIHEQVSESVQALCQAEGLETGRLPVLIHHYGYMPGRNPTRRMRNIRLLELSLTEHPRDPYFLYKLAGEVRQDDVQRSLTLLEQATEVLLALPLPDLIQQPYCLEVFALTVQQTDPLRGAEAALARCRQVSSVLKPVHPLFHYLEGNLLWNLGRKEEAVQSLELSIDSTLEAQDFYFDAGDMLLRAHQLLGEYAYQQGFYERARRHFERMLVLAPGHELARAYELRIKALLEDAGAALRAAFDWYRATRSSEAALLCGELLLAMGLAEAAERWLSTLERDFASRPEVLSRAAGLRQALASDPSSQT